MTQDELIRASEQIGSAASETSADDASERLTELAGQVSDIADGETEADHGRIARIQAALDELQPSLEDDVATTVDSARDELSAYRKTLDGV